MVLVWTKRLSFAATLALLFSLGITFWPASTVVEQPPVRIETDGIQPDELQSLPASPKSTPNPEPTHAIEVVSTTRQAPVKQQRSTLTPVQGLSAKSVHLTPTTASVALAEVILTAPTAYPLSPSENKIALPSLSQSLG
jgi:hypothetical protein